MTEDKENNIIVNTNSLNTDTNITRRLKYYRHRHKRLMTRDTKTLKTWDSDTRHKKQHNY